MEIRDPVHGSIEITKAETMILDLPLVQRLRRVKQLGFAENIFPGATHTRFLHSIGAMHLAGYAFEHISKGLSFIPDSQLGRLKTTLRLAALLHDIGHPPLSHVGERLLPPAEEIGGKGETTHEMMTVFLILHSEIADAIRDGFREIGVTPEDVASVLSGTPIDGEGRFLFDNIDVLPVLSQLISSELDVDRMDYLLRDSYFTGVSYGRFEKDWLLTHLSAVKIDNMMCLALDSNAILAFEDFLLSRYHMFLTVYFHRKVIGFERLLQKFISSDGMEIRLPSDPNAFAMWDDQCLLNKIRQSENHWAKRIIQLKPLKCAIEGWDEEVTRLLEIRVSLDREFPDMLDWADSNVALSKYCLCGDDKVRFRPFVKMDRPYSRSSSILPIEETSDVFEKYAQKRRILRCYCPEEVLEDVINAIQRLS